MQVPLKDIPADLIVEGETELGMNLKNRDETSISATTDFDLHFGYFVIVAHVIKSP